MLIHNKLSCFFQAVVYLGQTKVRRKMGKVKQRFSQEQQKIQIVSKISFTGTFMTPLDPSRFAMSSPSIIGEPDRAYPSLGSTPAQIQGASDIKQHVVKEEKEQQPFSNEHPQPQVVVTEHPQLHAVGTLTMNLNHNYKITSFEFRYSVHA